MLVKSENLFLIDNKNNKRESLLTDDDANGEWGLHGPERNGKSYHNN